MLTISDHSSATAVTAHAIGGISNPTATTRLAIASQLGRAAVLSAARPVAATNTASAAASPPPIAVVAKS